MILLQLEIIFYQHLMGTKLGQVNHQPQTFSKPAKGNLWAQFRCDHAVNHISNVIRMSFKCQWYIGQG